MAVVIKEEDSDKKLLRKALKELRK